jgi:Asp-tRNA(Asn)/Glu-tRNA(Gln) amidotransferase A subunit family amidase
MPTGDDLAYLGAARLAALIRDKQLSPVELVDMYLERIERLDARLGRTSPWPAPPRERRPVPPRPPSCAAKTLVRSTECRSR